MKSQFCRFNSDASIYDREFPSEKITFRKNISLKKMVSLKSSNPEGFWLTPPRKKVSSITIPLFNSTEGVITKENIAHLHMQ